jgi:8-oxo-dGTP diphosphatase
MTVYLVRHAHAGDRASWLGPDDEVRPLTDHGRRQSADLVRLFVDLPLEMIWTSPYLRCVETVAPLSARVGIPFTVTDALAEGPADAAAGLLRSHWNQHMVMCSHGDIIPALLSQLAADGLDLGAEPRCQKASVWIVEPGSTRGSFRSATYVTPPGH